MMTIILKYVCDWFDQRWVNLHTFYWYLFRFIWKKDLLMRNYLAEQEMFLNKKLSCRAREVWVSLFWSLDVKLSYIARKE
jgi:hypothetical protein